MKKLLAATLFISGVCLSAFASTINYPIAPSEVYCCDEITVVNVLCVTEQDLNSLMHGECPEVAIEFSKGTILPLNLFLKGNLMNIVGCDKQQMTQLEVKRTFYARHVENELTFSFNLTDWKPFLEFITGTFSVELGTCDEGPFLTIGAEADLKS